MKPVENILDVIVRCVDCNDMAYAVDTMDGLKCRFCGGDVEVVKEAKWQQ